MSQPDPLTRQHELLRDFRQAEEWRQEAENCQETGHMELQRARLEHLLEGIRPSQVAPTPGAASLLELRRSAEATHRATANLHTAVEDLLRWRKRRRRMITVCIVVSIVLCVALTLEETVYHQLRLAWYYQQAILAIQAQQWDRAADAILRVGEYNSNYHNLPDVIAACPDLLRAMESHYSNDWLGGRVVRRATLVSYNGGVNSVAFSPDGRTLASSGSWDGTWTLWDVATGRRIPTLSGNSSSVSSVAFSPDGRTLAVGSDDKTTILYDVATGQRIASFIGFPNPEEGGKWVTSVAFSPDGTLIASGTCRETVRRYYEGGGSYYDCAYGAALVWRVADRNGTALYTLESGEGIVKSVAFSPDGRLLASASEDSGVFIWDVATGQIVNTIDRSGDYLTFSPDGGMLALVSGGDVELLHVLTGSRVATFDGGRSNGDYCHNVSSVAFSPDGSTLAAGCSETVHLWGITTGQSNITVLGKREGAINRVAFSPDGRTLATGSTDGIVILWRAEK